MAFEMTDEHLADFQSQGFIVVPHLFNTTEISLLAEYAKSDHNVVQNATSRADADGHSTKLSLSNELLDTPYAAVVRSERIVSTMSRLLGDEVYHYHHKMMLKEPRVGGAWEWHQDYGYWYDFGCLFPTMASCFIAVDRCTRENGCLQVIPGSHHLGRMNHMKVAGQTGADPERVEAVLQRMSLKHVEMEPGDGLFFHGNLLHRSDQNTSDNARWSLICCYNTKQNDPYKKSRHPNYSQLVTLPDSEFETQARRLLDELHSSAG